MFFDLTWLQLAVYALCALLACLCHAYLRGRQDRASATPKAARDETVTAAPANAAGEPTPTPKPVPATPRDTTMGDKRGAAGPEPVTSKSAADSSEPKVPAPAAAPTTSSKAVAEETAAAVDPSMLDACLDLAWEDLTSAERKLDDAIADTLFKAAHAGTKKAGATGAAPVPGDANRKGK